MSTTELACFDFFLPVGYVGYILNLLCVEAIVNLCFYACMVFAQTGYREVMHGAVLSITGLTRPNLVPRPPW